MRWGRAIAGGVIAEAVLLVAVMPGFALNSQPIVTLRDTAHGERRWRRTRERMKAAALAAGVCLLLAAATPAHAQFRGRLSSRPPPTAPVPRSPANPPVLILPAWWQWGIVTLPDTIALTPPPLAEGGPTGGVQLDVLPWSAQVFVDGSLAGRVEEFRGYYRHLTLSAGPHVLAIVHPGYDPLVMDVVVVPGRTITWRATLRR